MNKPKFTKGTWRVDEDGRVRGAVCDRVLFTPNYNFDDWKPNVNLVVKATKMYALLDDIAEKRISGLSMYAAINTLLSEARGEIEK